MFENLRNTAESFKQIPSQFFQNSKVKTMGKSNFWRNILISSDFMRYLALQSIVQFSKLNIYLHTLHKEKLCEYEGAWNCECSFRNYFTPCSISVENAIFYWCFSRTLWAEGWGMEKESGWSLMAHLAYIYSPLKFHLESLSLILRHQWETVFNNKH